LTLGELDLRTAEGRYAKGIRKALIEHVGGSPTPAQQLLIGLVALKCLRMEMMVFKILSDEQIESGDDGKFLSWANSVRRDLEVLGVARNLPPPPSLEHYLLARRQQQNSGATA
jgi:hypothetical protein